MNSLLHAAAIILTVMLFLLQPRCPLAAVCYPSQKLNNSAPTTYQNFVYTTDYFTTKMNHNTTTLLEYKKLNISQHWFQSDNVKEIDSMDCARKAYHSAPKYKKDPPIHIDSELVGQEPRD
ncbi:jg15149 [Pararge aegeria aegeria]|uniref:Jg15149 protein n=1 Tax=Pararge aegeria aegeria TaxID=348720 RepID=A0A8S4S0Y4_9NEOP|nr:jg15149 [Pararge aegeria aegeria]